MIVFGLDPLAVRVATAVVSGEALVPYRLYAVTPLATDGGIVADLRRCAVDLMAAARARGESFEPRLACLVTASAPQAVAGLAALSEVCAMLQTLAAGNQTVSLGVLVPPVNADDVEKAASFRFFRALEDLIGEFPYLDFVWLNQLAYGAGSSADGAPGEELETLLVRELLDSDLRKVIASLGHTALNWRARVVGRKACYSTLGSHRLEYRPEEAVAYISGRLQREFLGEGLDASRLLEEDDLKAIQASVDDTSRRCLAAIIDRLPTAPTIDPDVIEGATETGALDRVLTTLAGDVGGAVDKVAPNFRELAALLDGWARKAFLDFLPTSPGYLTGARAFFDALLGRRLCGDEGNASGVAWVAQELCRQPADQSVVPGAQRLLQSLGLGSALLQEWPADVTLDWLTRTAQGLATGEASNSSPAGAPARLLAGVLGRLQGWSTGSDAPMSSAPSNVREIADVYLGEVVPLLGRQAENEAEVVDTERAIEALPNRYGLIRRLLTQRSAYDAELSTLARKRAELVSEREALGRALSQARSIIAVLFNEVLLPQVLRRAVAARLQRETEQASAEFSAFIDSLGKGVETHWARGAVFADEQRTTTHSRLLTDQRLEALYRTTLEREHIVLPHAVGEMLSFVPRVASSVPRQRSYGERHGLKGHYQEGAESILQRLADYAEQKAAWVRDLDALDIVECEGKDMARGFLTDVFGRSRCFLELSPGMLPLVEAQGRPRVSFFVRTAAPLARRLAAGYGGLFGPELSFVDTDDQCVIEVISVVVGFPAFLVHVLHEGRRLARAEDGEGAGDLWPC
jgi:hypothetical protein